MRSKRFYQRNLFDDSLFSLTKSAVCLLIGIGSFVSFRISVFVLSPALSCHQCIFNFEQSRKFTNFFLKPLTHLIAPFSITGLIWRQHTPMTSWANSEKLYITRRPASTGIFFAQLQILWSTFANGRKQNNCFNISFQRFSTNIKSTTAFCSLCKRQNDITIFR